VRSGSHKSGEVVQSREGKGKPTCIAIREGRTQEKKGGGEPGSGVNKFNLWWGWWERNLPWGKESENKTF